MSISPEDAARLTRERFWYALDQFAESLEPAIRKAFLEAVQSVRENFSDEDLARIAMTHDVTPLLAALATDTLKFALRDAVSSAAEQVAVLGKVAVRFDILHPYVTPALKDFESRAIAALEVEVRDGVLAYLRETVSRGMNPIQIARGLRDKIGLPQNMIEAGARHRAMLASGERRMLKEALKHKLRDARFDGSIQAAMNKGVALTPAQIDRQMVRYYEKALKHHTETIARTASMDAVNVANRLSWQQIISDGQVDVNSLRRYWVVAKDERVCPECKPIPELNPKGRGWDEPFETPVGPIMQPTLHFRCRCVIWTAIEET